MKINKFLEKISWRTRKWNYKFQLLNIYLHDHDGTWGFDFFTIHKNFSVYSLLRFECRLPNKTHIQRFTIDDWDILFTNRFLYNEYDKLSDRKLWSGGLSNWDTIKYNFLKRIL